MISTAGALSVLAICPKWACENLSPRFTSRSPFRLSETFTKCLSGQRAGRYCAYMVIGRVPGREKIEVMYNSSMDLEPSIT